MNTAAVNEFMRKEWGATPEQLFVRDEISDPIPAEVLACLRSDGYTGGNQYGDLAAWLFAEGFAISLTPDGEAGFAANFTGPGPLRGGIHGTYKQILAKLASARLYSLRNYADELGYGLDITPERRHSILLSLRLLPWWVLPLA